MVPATDFETVKKDVDTLGNTERCLHRTLDLFIRQNEQIESQNKQIETLMKLVERLHLRIKTLEGSSPSRVTPQS